MSGKDLRELHPLNKEEISQQYDIFQFDISGKDFNSLHP